MAIKGKGKTRPKQAPRAPRHEPVPVKPPLAQRGWVRALAAGMAGLLVMATVWWAWENLDQQQNAKDLATKQGLQRDALSAWGKGNLEPALTTVGQLAGGGAPQIAANVQTALDAIANGDPAGVTADEMITLADNLEKAADKLNKFALADTIANVGFEPSQTDVITSVQSEMVAGLRSLAVAARLVARMVDDPAIAKDLVDAAKGANDTGQALILRAWNSYTNETSAAGIPIQAAQPVPGSLGSGS
jgi:hypothetical protein